jgi:micrococcal nuclease
VRRLICLLAFLTAACTIASGTASTSSTQAIPSGSAPAGAPATVVTVLDGDSVRLLVDGTSVEVRLLGVNAPERDECWADHSRDVLDDLTAGQSLTVVGTDRDQYDRVLAYVYAGSTNLNLELIIDGAALAIATDHDLLPDFLVAEDEAVRLGAGLWAADACGPVRDETGVGIWAIEPDAPGRDDANPNGEFVTISNDGPDQDLTGWTLRDESSTHRFRFPDGFVLTSGSLVTVRSGCGTDTSTDLFWCADTTVWTNSGDTALLLDERGAVVERVRYFSD